MTKGIKFAGHTMGTPDKDIYEAITLMKEIGFDGIEVRVADNGQINSETITDEEVLKIAAHAKETGIEFACLTSYYQDFTPPARDDVIRNLKRVIDIASMLECKCIRVYGGGEPKNNQDLWFNDFWTYTVTGIREVAQYAAPKGVNIVLETHIGSLTMSARDTIHLIDDINMNNVGMLFDYAWVELAGAEIGADAVRKAARYIRHIHIKDWKLESRIPLKKSSCLMGEGTVNWPEVLTTLKEIGYTGFICDEYEKYWYPQQLPDPEIGMKANLEYCKKYLA